MAASVLESNNVNYVKVLEQATLQPDINSGMGFTEDDDDEEEMSSSRSGGRGNAERTYSNKRKPLQKSRLTIRRYWIISALI